MIPKSTAKRILGEIPFTAEAYWYLRQAGKPVNKSFRLQALSDGLPAWSAQAAEAAARAQPGRKILIFATLHYWISHAALTGLALAGTGHQVTLAYLPYGRWQQPVNRFDLRRQDLYAASVLQKATPVLQAVSFFRENSRDALLPPKIEAAVQEVSLKDTQYTLQVEEVSQISDLYRLREARNREVAASALAWLRREKPHMVVIPNGTIFEFGMVYRVARALDIPCVTYEFGEQRKRIWLAQNAEVMQQNTDGLWEARGGKGLTPDEMDQVRSLFAARQKASLWKNFSRRWQGVPSAGGDQIKQDLRLDERPIVLLATNVIGDSLTLGRQVFSDSMTGWLQQTVQFFAGIPGVQLVVRIHPGELVTKGPSVADVVKRALPGGLPEHIQLVAADAQVNTYDLVEIADLGLVYTTTVGLEMAMSGIPVIVIGRTHYRGKGFTIDPDSWEGYFEHLNQVLDHPEQYRLTRSQVDLAWEYAYRFFFEYPQLFPWDLVHFWDDLEEWPIERVLGEEGQARFGDSFRYLSGEPIEWSGRPVRQEQGQPA